MGAQHFIFVQKHNKEFRLVSVSLICVLFHTTSVRCNDGDAFVRALAVDRGDGYGADEGMDHDGCTTIARGSRTAQDEHSPAESAAVQTNEGLPGSADQRP